MSKPLYLLGSPEWLRHVFSTPPVRSLKGRSRSTRSHDFFSVHMARPVIVEGRNEHCAACVLEYLCMLGFLKRYKEQPFRADPDEFGFEIVPDFLAEGSNGQLYIVEVKTARFITAHLESILQRTREKFAEHGISYLLWSDRTPLNYALRHTIHEAKRWACLVDEEEQIMLRDHVATHTRVSVADLYEKGFDWGVIHAATWSGHVHFRLLDDFCFSTEVASSPLLDLQAIFLGSAEHGSLWWKSLAPYGGGQ